MIESFRHRGLKRLYERDDPRRVCRDFLDKVRTVLAHLDEAESIEEMGLPGFCLHSLKGNLKDHWSVSVSGNWRILFRFGGGKASDVDLVDDH